MQLPYLAFLSLFLFAHPALAQLELALTEAIHPKHWEEYYCKDSAGNPKLSMLCSNNRIPLYQDIQFENSSLPMVIYAKSGEAYMLEIKKCTWQRDRMKVKFLYDKRVKARMKLIKDDRGTWTVLSSLFRQKVACGGRKRGKKFSWTF